MGGIKKFMKSLEESRKKQVIFFCVSMVVITALYIPVMEIVSREAKYKRLVAQNVEIDYQILGNIDKISKGKNIFELNGWVCRIGEKVTDLYVILKEVGSQKERILDTDTYISSTVNEALTFDVIEESGVVAKIKDSMVKENVAYEILFAVEYEESKNILKTEKITTGSYLYNGEIYCYNPQTFVKPDIKEGRLAEIIDNGELRFFCSEHGLWLYLYEEKMCLIAKEGLVFNKGNLIDIPWFIYTLNETLKDRSVNTKDFIYYELDFGEEDYVKGEYEKYYYMYNELLSEYPITYVKTGIWKNEGWVCMPVISVFELENQ